MVGYLALKNGTRDLAFWRMAYKHMNKLFIETKRLIIVPPSMDYLNENYALESDPDVMRYLSGSLQKEATLERLHKLISHYNKHGFSSGFVFEKETGNFIGRAGLIYLGLDDTQPEIEIGYVLNKNSWKKGYATELAKEILNWGFKNLTRSRLLGSIHPENEASRHVLEKSGMTFIGKYLYCDSGSMTDRYEILRNQTREANK